MADGLQGFIAGTRLPDNFHALYFTERLKQAWDENLGIISDQYSRTSP